MHENRFVPTTCIGQSSVAWRLLTRPDEEKKNRIDHAKVFFLSDLNDQKKHAV